MLALFPGRRAGRRMRLLAIAVVAAALLAGCQQGKAPEAADGQQDLRGDLDAAMAYLAGLRDGGGRWPAGQVPYIVEAAATAGLDVQTWPGPVPVAHQVAWPPDEASFLAALRPLHAEVLAAQDDATRLARVRDRVLAGFDGAQFGEPALLNDDAFALIVLAAAKGNVSEVGPAIQNLLESTSPRGGWSWAMGGEPETDMTGMVLQALAVAGAMDDIDTQATLGFLDATRTADGGYGLQSGGDANCDSTVWGIRARGLLGASADASSWGFLLSLQRGDGGFAYTLEGPSNALCTAEAATLLGLALHGQVPLPGDLGAGPRRSAR